VVRDGRGRTRRARRRRDRPASRMEPGRPRDTRRVPGPRAEAARPGHSLFAPLRGRLHLRRPGVPLRLGPRALDGGSSSRDCPVRPWRGSRPMPPGRSLRSPTRSSAATSRCRSCTCARRCSPRSFW
jgi:hypothetical protein